MNRRLIARLDVKMEHLIKGIHLEGWRKVGDPKARAKLYYEEGADELLYMDVVASLYGRNNLSGIVREVASEVFIPITVGGGSVIFRCLGPTGIDATTAGTVHWMALGTAA